MDIGSGENRGFYQPARRRSPAHAVVAKMRACRQGAGEDTPHGHQSQSPARTQRRAGDTVAVHGDRVAAPPAPAPVPAIADTVGRCFELRDRAPADAIALVHAALTTPGLTADDEIKLLACRIRAEALSGSAGAVIATADRLETRLQDEPRPPEFVLRALSNAGAALHTVGQVPRALALYRRAYEAAEADESDLAQVKMLINVGSIQSEYLQAYALAETTFEQAATIGARSGVFDPLLPYNRGLNFLRMGDAARAGRQFETALASEQVTDTVLARRLRAEQLALAAARTPRCSCARSPGSRAPTIPRARH